MIAIAFRQKNNILKTVTDNNWACTASFVINWTSKARLKNNWVVITLYSNNENYFIFILVNSLRPNAFEMITSKNIQSNNCCYF